MPQPITWTIPATLAQTQGLKPEANQSPSQTQPSANGDQGNQGETGPAKTGNANQQTGQTGASNQADTDQGDTQTGETAPGNAGKTGPATDKEADNNGWLSGGSTMLIVLMFFVVLWIFLMGGQRKEKKKRGEMLASLQKGSRIQTVGGVLGTIVELRDDEVIVKVDENTNARMRFARTAISSVRDEEGEGDSD